MKPTLAAFVLIGVAVVAGAVGYIVAPSGSIEPTPTPTVTVSAEPSPEPTRFADSDYFPYGDAGWQMFFGGSGGGIAVLRTSETSFEYVDCRDLLLPMFEGHVDEDAVEYYLRPDDRVFSWSYNSPTAGSSGGWIAYRDTRCMKRLTPEIRDFIQDALANYRRSGFLNSGHPDGP